MRPEDTTSLDYLKDPDFDVVPYGARVAALAHRAGIDLSATVFALEALPLGTPRDRHAAVRRAAALRVAAAGPALSSALPGIVARGIAPLTRPGRVELMSRVVGPMVADVLEILSGAHLEPGDHALLSRVFSQTLGPAKRRRLESGLRSLDAELRRQFPAEDDLAIGTRLSLLILGRDALIGTLALSLNDAIGAGPRRFAELRLPEAPGRTGVPYIDRVGLAAGATDVRIRLDALERKDAKARLGFFGAGAHVCLGRALSIELWRELGRELPRLPGTARVTALDLRQDDVFAIPERFELEIA